MTLKVVNKKPKNNESQGGLESKQSLKDGWKKNTNRSNILAIAILTRVFNYSNI